MCGSWVDKEIQYEMPEDDEAEYQLALEHMARLIEYDVNSAQRLGVHDEKSDWYDLAKNPWLNTQEREHA